MGEPVLSFIPKVERGLDIQMMQRVYEEFLPDLGQAPSKEYMVNVVIAESNRFFGRLHDEQLAEVYKRTMYGSESFAYRFSNQYLRKAILILFIRTQIMEAPPSFEPISSSDIDSSKYPYLHAVISREAL